MIIVKNLIIKQKLTELEKISSNSSILNVGYFLLNSMANKLDMDLYFDSFSSEKKIQHNLYDLLKYLSYTRVVKPSSKIDTYYNILPSLYNGKLFTKDQIYDSNS